MKRTFKGRANGRPNNVIYVKQWFRIYGAHELVTRVKG